MGAKALLVVLALVAIDAAASSAADSERHVSETVSIRCGIYLAGANLQSAELGDSDLAASNLIGANTQGICAD